MLSALTKCQAIQQKANNWRLTLQSVTVTGQSTNRIAMTNPPLILLTQQLLRHFQLYPETTPKYPLLIISKKCAKDTKANVPFLNFLPTKEERLRYVKLSS